MDECKMKEEIQQVINKQSLQMDMQEYITSNFPSCYAKFTIKLLQKGKMEESNFFIEVGYYIWMMMLVLGKILTNRLHGEKVFPLICIHTPVNCVM